MNKRQLDALEQVLEYLASERRHYESNGCPNNHIYRSVEILERFFADESGLNKPRKRLSAKSMSRAVLTTVK